MELEVEEDPVRADVLKPLDDLESVRQDQPMSDLEGSHVTGEALYRSERFVEFTRIEGTNDFAVHEVHP